MNRKKITEHYRENREEIEGRLKDFKKLRDSSEDRKFKELVFVILTSQTEAEKAWSAVKSLDEENLIQSGGKGEISRLLDENSVSYPDDKASYIRENFRDLSQPTLEDPEQGLKISRRINTDDLESTRSWFAENVKGISWKGASHFLRNIGYGNGFAIISGHISSQMFELGLTETPEPPENREEYMDMEEKLQEFSDKIGIDIKALDLVLWSMKTGEVFK